MCTGTTKQNNNGATQWRTVVKLLELVEGKSCRCDSLPHGSSAVRKRKEKWQKKTSTASPKSVPQFWLCASCPDHGWLIKGFYKWSSPCSWACRICRLWRSRTSRTWVQKRTFTLGYKQQDTVNKHAHKKTKTASFLSARINHVYWHISWERQAGSPKQHQGVFVQNSACVKSRYDGGGLECTKTGKWTKSETGSWSQHHEQCGGGHEGWQGGWVLAGRVFEGGGSVT